MRMGKVTDFQKSEQHLRFNVDIPVFADYSGYDHSRVEPSSVSRKALPCV